MGDIRHELSITEDMEESIKDVIYGNRDVMDDGRGFIELREAKASILIEDEVL